MLKKRKKEAFFYRKIVHLRSKYTTHIVVIPNRVIHKHPSESLEWEEEKILLLSMRGVDCDNVTIV